LNRLARLVRTITEAKSSWDTVFLKNIESTLEDHNVMGHPYTKSDLVYICISTTAKAISQVPLQVMQPGVEGKLEPVGNDHPWTKLLKKPNYLLDQYSFVEAIVSYLMLDGDVWIVPFPPDWVGAPDSLWVVSRKNMQPVRDRGTGHLIGWRYSPSPASGIKEKFDLDPAKVCHIWFWNPYDPIMGQAPLIAGKMSIVGDFRAAYYNAVFFEEGAAPGGVLTTESKLSDKQYARLKEQLESRHKGYRRGHRLMLLEQGLQYSQTALTHKDMEFYDLRRFNQERILQIFGMKKAVISVTDDLNYATAREQRKSWWQDTNLPIMRSVASALNFVFMESLGLELQFDVSSIEALHEDFNQKVRTAERLARLGFTANEINERLELGFENKPWRDYFYMPATLIPIGDDQPAPLPPPEQQELVEGEVVKRLPSPVGKTWEVKAEQQWKSLTRKLGPVENRLEGKIKRVFFSMRKKILKALYEGTKSPQDVLELDLSVDEKELKRWIMSAYEEALIIGISSIEDELGIVIDFGLNDPVVVNFLAQKNMKLSGITRTIRKRVAQQLAEGASKGETIDELAARIKNEFNFASKRARTIARTEVVGANNFARHETLSRTEYQEFRWFTALDEKVRASHAAMHGQTRKVGEPWIVGGVSLRYPGDFAGPASEVINCVL